MKRMFILITLALFAMGTLFAEEAVLIDFTKLAADIIPDQNNPDRLTQNRATMMDYARVAGGSFTPEQRAVMKTSLAIRNWDVVLASSSRTVENQVRSYTDEARSTINNGFVMGVRVHFPVEPYNSWAIIKPPFDIPAFEPQATITDEGEIQPPAEGNNGITGPSRFEGEVDDNGRPSGGLGVVKNVGTIKSVAVSAYGLNFPHGVSAILVDSQGNSQTVFLGYLNFDGWGELIWNNPMYIENVRNRSLRLYPLYPTSTPFVKFGGFLIQRDAANEGGDFIGYFKDVRIIYDKAVLDTTRDIDDEDLWHIIYDRETDKKRFEMERFGHNQVLRYLEEEKRAKDLPFGDPEREQQQQNTTP
ncbi:MAG: flagellar filament outer layer protein FlaA [Spirochaetaceae bacterium]|jgi:hypothetical protein|nr:flagellar filament outer layer protein FlaA [Spirochaetaceae bacterium]